MLNGAPLCIHLDFNADALLDPEDCYEHYPYFFRAPMGMQNSRMEDEPSAQPKWRHLTDASTRLRTGWSQTCLPGGGIYEGHSNFSFTAPILERSFDYLERNSDVNDTTNTLDDSPEVDNFLQHSLLLHDTLLSSQIAMDTGVDDPTSSPSFLSTSFASITTETSTPLNGEGIPNISNIPATINATPLSAFPNAQFIRSIYPQTPTRNVLCVLTTQPEHREVIVRRGGYRMQIYEITVADDTKAGFKISFWFRPPKLHARAQDRGQENLRETLERSKVGDILLLRNVVLNVFRDDVYGQSLNPTITRLRTDIEVLKRGAGLTAANLNALPAAIVEMFVKVKKWANIHVAVESANTRKRRRGLKKKERRSKMHLSFNRDNETLPPDTMET